MGIEETQIYEEVKQNGYDTIGGPVTDEPIDNDHLFRDIINPGWRHDWESDPGSEKITCCACSKIIKKKKTIDTKINHSTVDSYINYKSYDCCFGLFHSASYKGFDDGNKLLCCCNTSHLFCGNNDRACYESCSICGTGQTFAAGTEGGCGLSLCGIGCFLGTVIQSLRICGKECGYWNYD